MYALSEALKERTAQLTEQRLRNEFAHSLLKTHQPIPYVVKMSKLSEEVVREIAAIVDKENGAE